MTGQFNVKLATGSTFLSVSRKNGWVTATGTTRQFERSANYGSGGWMRHSEAVTVQYQKGTGWYAVKKFTSAGSFKVTYRGTVTRNYRLLIPLDQHVAAVPVEREEGLMPGRRPDQETGRTVENQ